MFPLRVASVELELIICCATSQAASLADALGKDGGLGHVEVKPGILLEDVLEISQDLERHAHHLGVDVPIVSKSKRRACGYFASVRPRKWRVVRLNT